MTNKKQPISIFIDESGTLPDPDDKVVIVAAVGTSLPKKLLEVTRKTRKKLVPKENQLSEIKFYYAGARTKRIFLKELARQPVEIFTLTIEKAGQSIADTPDNFATLCWLLLEDCLLFYKSEVREVVFDKHFHKARDRDVFDKTLSRLLEKKLKFSHADSIQDPRVNTADMVAGSVLWYHSGKDKQFYEILKDKIVSEKVVHWKKARKRLFVNKNRKSR